MSKSSLITIYAAEVGETDKFLTLIDVVSRNSNPLEEFYVGIIRYVKEIDCFSAKKFGICITPTEFKALVEPIMNGNDYTFQSMNRKVIYNLYDDGAEIAILHPNNGKISVRLNIDERNGLISNVKRVENYLSSLCGKRLEDIRRDAQAIDFWINTRYVPKFSGRLYPSE